VSGLHDAIRWYAAGVFGCPVRQVAVTQAHYVAGRDSPRLAYDQVLADHAITRHDVPVTAQGEAGADVELALTGHQIACETSPAMIAPLAGDGDFAPLAARLAGGGLRVLVPGANLSYPAHGSTVTVTTSAWLTRAATDTPELTDLLDATLPPPTHATSPARRPSVSNREPLVTSHRQVIGRDEPEGPVTDCRAMIARNGTAERHQRTDRHRPRPVPRQDRSSWRMPPLACSGNVYEASGICDQPA
jgi:hypothetical protein